MLIVISLVLYNDRIRPITPADMIYSPVIITSYHFCCNVAETRGSSALLPSPSSLNFSRTVTSQPSPPLEDVAQCERFGPVDAPMSAITGGSKNKI